MNYPVFATVSPRTFTSVNKLKLFHSYTLFLDYLYYLDPEDLFKKNSTFGRSNASFFLQYFYFQN